MNLLAKLIQLNLLINKTRSIASNENMYGYFKFTSQEEINYGNKKI